MAGANREAPTKGDAKPGYLEAFNIADATHLYVGEMSALRLSDDKLIAAVNAAGNVVVGVNTLEVNNSVSGDTMKDISIGVHGMVNSSTNAITRDNISDLCYVEDAATVSLSGTVVAGVVVDVDSTDDLVYVDFDPGKAVK